MSRMLCLGIEPKREVSPEWRCVYMQLAGGRDGN